MDQSDTIPEGRTGMPTHESTHAPVYAHLLCLDAEEPQFMLVRVIFFGSTANRVY
jgi:hypothetical protein